MPATQPPEPTSYDKDLLDRLFPVLLKSKLVATPDGMRVSIPLLASADLLREQTLKSLIKKLGAVGIEIESFDDFEEILKRAGYALKTTEEDVVRWYEHPKLR